MALTRLYLLAAALVSLAPLITALIAAFQPSGPLSLPPKNLSFEGFAELARLDAAAAFFNTAVVVALTLALTFALSLPTAYAFTRLGAGPAALVAFMVLLGLTRSLPPAALLPAVYNALYDMRLVDSYVGIALAYQIYTVLLALWLLTAFSLELDPDPDRAAKIDGAGPASRFLKVYLPAVAPGVVATALLAGVEIYGEYLYAAVLLTQEHQTVALLVGRLLTSEFRTEWNVLGAASIAAAVPLLVAVYATAKSWRYLALGTGGRRGTL